MSATTVCAAFQATVAANPDGVALRTPGDAVRITWAEYGRRVRSIAAGLAGLGVRRGDTVALMLRNRPEFNLVDLAVLHLGAIPFSIYNTSPAEQITHLLGNAGAKIAITERVFLERIQAVREQAGLAEVISVDGGAVPSLAELEAAGGELDFDASWQAVRPDDLLTIIYTSGTTGPAKGAEITHANQMAMYSAWQQVMTTGPGDALLSYLPSAHGVDRLLTHYLSVASGAMLTTLAESSGLASALVDTRPSLFIGVPRIWEKFQAALLAGISALPAETRTAAETAIEYGRAKVRAEQSAGADAEMLARWAAADRAVFAGLRTKLGLDRARYVAAGAAPAAADTLEFFHAIGLPILEGWGMTELSGVATANPPGTPKLGTVGTALPGVELTVAEDGELLVRGPIVMRGYRGAPDKTSEAIDSDGWLHTGDIARIDAAGYVTIVDRKKELIINAAGKNMSPANIEAAVKGASPLIGQCVCIGDRRPYNVALLVLDPDGAAAFAREHDLAAAGLADDPVVAQAIAAAIEKANTSLARIEQIKRYIVLDADWQADSDELTPTMKLKRKPIAEKYAEEIEALYRTPSLPGDHRR